MCVCVWGGGGGVGAKVGDKCRCSCFFNRDLVTDDGTEEDTALYRALAAA